MGGSRMGVGEVATVMKVSEQLRDRLKKLAASEGKSMQGFLEERLDEYEERQFFQELHEGFSRLRADSDAWADYSRELEEWDAVLSDGLQGWE